MELKDLSDKDLFIRKLNFYENLIREDYYNAAKRGVTIAAFISGGGLVVLLPKISSQLSCSIQSMLLIASVLLFVLNLIFIFKLSYLDFLDARETLEKYQLLLKRQEIFPKNQVLKDQVKLLAALIYWVTLIATLVGSVGWFLKLIFQ